MQKLENKINRPSGESRNIVRKDVKMIDLVIFLMKQGHTFSEAMELLGFHDVK